MDATTLTPNEIATRLRTRPATVRAWIKSGRLRAINAAEGPLAKPRYKVELSDLTAFLDTLKQSAPACPPATVNRRNVAPVKAKYV